VISKEEAASRFRQIIGQKASWLRLMGSQFIEHLAVFVSWCLRETLWRLERLNQEFFLSTALNRSSILAHVEDREYVPRKRTPSSGTVRITNNGDAAISLPIHTPFVSDAQLNYVTTATAAVTIQPGQYSDVPLSQMEVDQITATISQEMPFYQILLSKEQTKRLHSFEVYLNIDDRGFELWSYERLFKNTGPADTIYDEFYSHTDQTGIRFGNGTFGVVPPLNSLMRIDLWLTDGETVLVTGQTLNIIDTYLVGNDASVNIEVITQGAIEGGAVEESLEEIRTGLHYWPLYNEKLVWEDDYEFFIRKYLPEVLWVNAWGEEEQEIVTGFNVHNLNKIFITAYAKDNDNLGDDVLALFSDTHLLNRKFQWIIPVFSPFSLVLTGKVGRTVIISEAIEKILGVLETCYGKDSAKREAKAFVKDFYRLIEETGYFSDRGANFEITYSGPLQATLLQEMIHIDLDVTEAAINLTYV
jgi:hypothetical protein